MSPDAVFVCSAYSDKTVYTDHVDHMASSSTSETVDEIQARTTLSKDGVPVDGKSSTAYNSWDAAVYDTYPDTTAGQ